MTCPPNCKGPGADCLGFCIPRQQIEFAGPEPEEKPQPKDSPITCALCVYRTHRPAGRLVAVRQAFKAWRNK